MAKIEPDIQPGNDEFSRIFSEYHAKIDEITRRTEKRLKFINDEEEAPAETAAPAEKRPETPPPPPAPEEPEPEPEKITPPLWSTADRVYPVREPEAEPPPAESAEVIREAKRQAKKMIEEAEQKVKKEAKKKTQAEVDKLLEKARKEAEDIIFSARQAAEKDKNEIIAITRHETEQAITEITTRCRLESQAGTARAITGAAEKAQRIMADVIESGTEINRLIGEMIDRTEKAVTEFELKLREETTDIARVIKETRRHLEEVTAAARAAEVSLPTDETAPEEPEEPDQQAGDEIAPDLETNENVEAGAPSLGVHLLGERSNGNNGTAFLFRGQVEMKSSSAVDYQYLKNLKKYMVGIPEVKYLQEYASEKEMSVLFDIREPLPIIDVLRRVPMVDNVVPGTEDDFCIVFKAQ